MDLHRKARAGLALELPPDEAVRVVIPGLASSALVATNARAFVFKMGAKAGLPFATQSVTNFGEPVVALLSRTSDLSMVARRRARGHRGSG